MSNVVKPTDYAFALGRIRAVERNLLDSSKIQQIADAKTVDDALNLIYDAGYKKNADYEVSFNAALEQVYKTLYEITPEPQALDLFLIKNDYHNLKVLLKAEFLNKDLSHLLFNNCLFGVDSIKSAVSARDAKELSEIFDNTLKDAANEFALSKNAQAVDMIIDRGMFENIKYIAKQVDNEFISKVLKIQIDISNILTYFRLQRLKKNADFARRALIEGGSLDTYFFIENLELSNEAAAAAFSKTPYRPIFEKVAEVFSGDLEKIARLEVLLGDYLLGYIKKSKYINFGPEPLISYLLSKENEIKQLGIIMVGKINKMDINTVKERLNTTYV